MIYEADGQTVSFKFKFHLTVELFVARKKKVSSRTDNNSRCQLKSPQGTTENVSRATKNVSMNESHHQKRQQQKKKKTFRRTKAKRKIVSAGSLKLISAFSPFLLESHLLWFCLPHRLFLWISTRLESIRCRYWFHSFSSTISFNCHHILSSFDSSRISSSLSFLEDSRRFWEVQIRNDERTNEKWKKN